MSEKTRVNITPDKSLIQKLGLTGYKTEQAIAELIDNSIDARIPGKIERIDVRLNFENKTIEVTDNGSGMNLEELQNALTIAKGTKEDETKLGKFGLGMKSACSTLGKSFTIITTKPDSGIEYLARYDEDKWLNDKSLDWTNFEVEKNEKQNKWHGTIIVISKLNIPLYSNQTSKFKKRYGIRYGPHLENKQIRLTINSHPCVASIPNIQKDSKKELDIKLPSGNTIKGWIGLLEKRSIKGDYGIHLFKNGRLIKAFDDFGFTRHPEVAKIIGEISLDHVPVNFHKTGFIEDSLEYKESTTAFRNNPIVKEILRNAGSQLTTMSSLEPIFDYLSGNAESGLIDTKISATNAKELLQQANNYAVNGEHKFEIVFEDGENDDEFYSINDTPTKIIVTVNRNSNVFKAVKNPLFIIGLIYIESKLFLQNKHDFKIFLQDRNKLWGKFIKDWSTKDKPQKHEGKTLEPQPKYLLSDDLTDLHDYLIENFEHNIQFTGLSMLYVFLQNAYGKIIYHIHTIKGAGQQLQDLISKYADGKKFIALLNPTRQELQNAMDFSEKNKFIVIREYSEKPTTPWATAEKAWLDLYTEIKKNLLPIPSDEIFIILDNLLESNLIDENKLKALARHRHQLADVVEFLE